MPDVPESAPDDVAEPAPESASEPAPERPRRALYRRWWFWTAIGLVLALVLGFGAWIGVRAMEARSELEAAQALTGTLKTQATGLDIDGATSTLDEITTHTARARSLTGDPVWRAGELVPLLGANLTAVREIAAVTDDLMTDVAAPLIAVAASIDPASFAPKNGAIDLGPLGEAAPAIERANDGIQRASSAVAAIDTGGTIEQIADAKRQITALLAEVKPVTESLAAVVPLLPPALGSEAPRTYLVIFQNNAESRALGGTALSLAVVGVDQGRIQLIETRSARLSDMDVYAESVVPIPDGAEQVYPAGTFGTTLANSTIRPSFTTTAQIVHEMWRRQFGTPVDGILSLDPIALGYILGATDPIQLSSGDLLSSETAVSLLLNEVYLRFDSGISENDNIAQDAIYAESIGLTFARISNGPLDPAVLVPAVVRGWDERRILYWSAHEEEEAQLAEIGLSGELPRSDAETERIGLYFQENVGSKMNYYLTQTVRLGAASCRDDGRPSYRVSVDLANTIPPAIAASLPISVVGAWEREQLQPGVQRMIVRLYAPPGGQLVGASINGAPVAVQPLHDTDFPVGQLVISLPPGTSGTVAWDFIGAGSALKSLEAQITPMINETAVGIEDLDCASVPAG